MGTAKKWVESLWSKISGEGECIEQSSGAMLGEEGKPLQSPQQNGQIAVGDGEPEPDRIVPRLFKRRWVMVFLFATYSASNAYQWIHLNIIENIIYNYYNASLPGNEYQQHLSIHWLSMIYMLAYIPLIIPATWLLDKKGLRICGILATLLNAVGAWVKCAALSPDRFGVLMFGQVICAIAQIFILGIPARLAAVWFGPNEVSTATAIGVFGNQLGCALGFLIPPEIVPDDPSLDVVGHRLSIMLYSTAGVCTALFILVIAVYKNGPPVPPSLAQVALVEQVTKEDYFSSLKRLLFHKGFLLLTITYGLNTGSYYAIGTLLNPVVLYYFPGESTNIGRMGLTLVLAGILGSIVAGIWLDRTKFYKSTTVGIYFFSLVGMVVFTFTLRLNHIWIAFLCSGALGFFMTGYLPVGFEFAAEITYPEPEGTSSGLLNASAQTFGIILTISMGAIKDSKGVLAANILVCAALLVGSIATVFIPGDLHRQAAMKPIDLDVDVEEKQSLKSKEFDTTETNC